MHAVLVAKDGGAVYEEYFAGEDVHGRDGALGRVAFDRETRHDLRSVSKSVVSLVLGTVLGEDTLALDRPILEHFPEYREVAAPGWGAVTLRHVLDMTSGVAWSEAGSYDGAGNDGSRMGRSADPTRFVLQRPVLRTPGSTWNYSGGNTHLLMEVIQRRAGRPFLEVAREALFTPLGVTDVEWMPYEGNDLPDADSGLRLRPMDLLALGLLVEGSGAWRGRQIVPAAWIEASWRPNVTTTDSPVELGADGTLTLSYARQWWHATYDLPYGRVTAHWALGNGGQLLLVVPAARLVVVVTGGRYDQSQDAQRLVIERILPWALGMDSRDNKFPRYRTFRALRPGEWQERALTHAEQARYVGRYLYDTDTVVVLNDEGMLRVANFAGDGGEPLALIAMGEHAFALGKYEGGTLTRIYWPGDRVTFVLGDGRVTGFVEHAVDGPEYGRATRLP